MKSLRTIIFTAVVSASVVIATAQVRRITPYFPCSPTLSDAYGFCSHITRTFADFYLRESDLRYAHEAGAKWIRSDFDCATVMPEGKEHPRDSIFDAVMKSCEADDMRLLPILTGRTNKAWAWDDEDGFYAYVDHLVRRYKGRIGYCKPAAGLRARAAGAQLREGAAQDRNHHPRSGQGREGCLRRYGRERHTLSRRRVR